MPADSRDFATGLSLPEAIDRIVARSRERVWPNETIAIEAALGRVLAEDVHAPFDVPGFANSAMDGFALHGADLPAEGERAFALIGDILAGSAARMEIGVGQCARITTGAPIPPGADTVVIKENVRVDGDQVWIAADEKPQGNTRPAGEDYRRGDLALHRGTRLTPARLGVLASFGQQHVAVSARVRAVLLTTGDELVPVGSTLGYGRIHDSNRYSLGGLLHAAGVEIVRRQHVRDDRAALREALLRAAADADIVVSSGGVSAGEADFLPGVLAEIGQIHLWKVRIKPGMPFLFGGIGDALVFSLPGNPVSGVATFLSLVRPALDVLAGAREIGIAPWPARLQTAIRKPHRRTEFLRATLHRDADAVLWATPLTQQGSGMLRGVADADALLIVPEETQELAAGSVVAVLPLPGVA